MTVSVMLVDDSAVIRGLLNKVLERQMGISVVANAFNGQQAIKFASSFKPDVILLDIEMPVLDGLQALPEILAASPKSKVIMVSALTYKNAEAAIIAMKMGASDYIAKPSEYDKISIENFYRDLLEKVTALAGSAQSEKLYEAANLVSVDRKAKISAVAIACSTGGPNSLLALFEKLVGQLSHLPIFITQHMAATFTTVLAENLAKVAQRPCREGRDHELVENGNIYVAPGGFHMLAKKNGTEVRIALSSDEAVNFCRPSADPMFSSLSQVYGQNLLAVVLTGMGQDGCAGAKIVARNGGLIMAESQETAIVYGMPKAVVEAGLCNEVLPLHEIPKKLVELCTI